MDLISVYSTYCDEYTKLYGDRTLVLMQVGSFYKIMCNEPNVLKEISTITNLQISIKSYIVKCYTVGFPIICADEYVKLLVDNNYTVVLVDYVDNDDSYEYKRYVSNVLSKMVIKENEPTESSDDDNISDVCLTITI